MYDVCDFFFRRNSGHDYLKSFLQAFMLEGIAAQTIERVRVDKKEKH
jgi:hypothetical protein